MSTTTTITQNAVFGGGLERTPKLKDFIWSKAAEPHAARQKAILKAHPEIKKLFGYEPLTKYYTTGLVLLQFLCAYLLRDMTWTWQFWLVAYVIGATATQAIFLSIHEVTHGLGFKKTVHNKMFNVFSNLPIGIPYCTAFKGYHLEHHKFQGNAAIDTDLPTAIEAVLFSSVLGKIFFATFQILFYAIRPMAVKSQAPTKWHGINWLVQLTFDFIVVSNFGWGPILYFLMSDLLSGSLHPCASHFIAEHYVFSADWETYSYYGPLNMLCYNVGYHNEHHDFPNIPWSGLPKVRKIAPEFYDCLPHHESWPLVLWKFITDPSVTLYNRVKRKNKSN